MDNRIKGLIVIAIFHTELEETELVKPPLNEIIYISSL